MATPPDPFDEANAAIRRAVEASIAAEGFLQVFMKDGDILDFYPLSIGESPMADWVMEVAIGILLDAGGNAEGWKGIPLFLIDRVEPQLPDPGDERAEEFDPRSPTHPCVARKGDS